MLLQIQDVLQAITPSSQKGFLRGRQMVEHAIKAVDFWGRNPRCVVVAIDFQKAYDNVHHSFVQAMLRYLMIGQDYIALLVQLLTAELIIELCGEVVQTAVVRPRSGVRQGDPLSPALFSALTLALTTYCCSFEAVAAVQWVMWRRYCMSSAYSAITLG